MPDPANDKTGGYFPLTVIRTLLFGDDHMPESYRSKAPNDMAKVIKLPIGVGLYLQSLDTTESYFHIEIYPETSHAEVWLTFEWQESSARNIKLRATLATEKAERDKHNSRMAAMLERMPKQLSDGVKIHLAETILRELHCNKFDKVLQFLDVAELAAQFEKEDQKNEVEEGDDIE